MKALTFLMFLALSACSAGKTDGRFSLTVMHTNDIHARLLPFDDNGKDCDFNNVKCAGGLAGIAAVAAEQRRKNPQALLFDAGDRFTGTPFYTLHKSRDISMLMNEADYSAMTLGNHDFDDGTEELERFVKSSSAPVVAANVVFAENSALKELIAPFVILQSGGKKIGVTGLVTPDTPLVSSAGGEASFLPVKDALAAVLPDMKKAGAEIIIALTHIGLDADKELAQTTDGIDIIVGGHSHSLLSNKEEEKNREGAYPVVVKSPSGSPVLIVSAGENGRYVGVLTAVFDKTGRLFSFEGDTVKTDGTVPPDEKAQRLVQAYAAEAAMLMSEPVTELRFPASFGKNGACAEECLAGEFVTDTLLSAFPQADGVMINSGAVRNPLPAGKVAFGNVLETYPFENEAVIAMPTGREIRALLESAAARAASDERAGKALLQTAGISYAFDLSAEPGKRVFDVKIKENGVYVPLRDESRYKIVMNDFIAKGGDGVKPVQGFGFLGRKVRDALIETWKKTPVFSPRLEKRILNKRRS